jgi:hypothetical protein
MRSYKKVKEILTNEANKISEAKALLVVADISLSSDIPYNIHLLNTNGSTTGVTLSVSASTANILGAASKPNWSLVPFQISYFSYDESTFPNGLKFYGLY